MKKHHSFTLLKPNPKGTGAALKLALYPAHNGFEGFVRAEFAAQESAMEPRSFDWDNSMCLKLGFDDICRLLQVFRGECEQINEGKGVVHKSKHGIHFLNLSHHIEPVCGYRLDYRRAENLSNERSISVFIAPHEALGICYALEHALGLLVFGIPEVIAD